MIKCPICGTLHENVRGKCPRSDLHPQPRGRGKRAVQPRELGPKYRCGHGILLHRICQKCERLSAEDCEPYRRQVLNVLKHMFKTQQELSDFLAAVDLLESQQGK